MEIHCIVRSKQTRYFNVNKAVEQMKAEEPGARLLYIVCACVDGVA